jgi:hypothetical protein
MLIAAANPFKGRHFPGEMIVLFVRWYLLHDSVDLAVRRQSYIGLGNDQRNSG